MNILNALETAQALPWDELIDALRNGFKQGCEMPIRQHQSFAIPGEESGTLLLMPAWLPGKYFGTKQVLVIPENGKRGLSSVNATYQLSSAVTGEPLLYLDGNVLTDRRTAAASALASTYLSREESKHLLMVGTGRLASRIVQAHCAARAIDTVSLWGRDTQKSEALAMQIRDLGFKCKVVEDLEAAVKTADIISCATGAKSPLIKGKWLTPGTHIDLVGAFDPSMRETDDEVMRRANIFVDTDDAIEAAGDITQAIESDAISESDISANLYDLTRGIHKGRCSENEVTVFKSVGTALEDLTAAVMAFERP